ASPFRFCLADAARRRSARGVALGGVPAHGPPRSGDAGDARGDLPRLPRPASGADSCSPCRSRPNRGARGTPTPRHCLQRRHRRTLARGRGAARSLRGGRDRDPRPRLGGRPARPRPRGGRRMRYSPVLDRLAGLGSAKWAVHYAAADFAARGRDVIDLTIGNPDVAAPDDLLECAVAAMRAGRTQYSTGRGEPALRAALAARYAARAGRPVSPDQVLGFPGTQTALYAVLMGLAEPGGEVLVGDPMYATYEAVIRAGGALPVPVPLRAERGFRFSAEDLSARVTPRSRAILLNTPHNPTGAVLTPADLAAIGDVARAH